MSNVGKIVGQMHLGFFSAGALPRIPLGKLTDSLAGLRDPTSKAREREPTSKRMEGRSALICNSALIKYDEDEMWLCLCVVSCAVMSQVH